MADGLKEKTNQLDILVLYYTQVTIYQVHHITVETKESLGKFHLQSLVVLNPHILGIEARTSVVTMTSVRVSAMARDI